MNRRVTFGKVLLFIIIAYLLIGLVNSVAGYVQNAITPQEVTFSPLIGIPLDMVGWPWSMWGDLTHGSFDIQFFVTLAAILIAFILFLRLLLRKPGPDTKKQ